jgi:CheY-like chemotaxis protein
MALAKGCQSVDPEALRDFAIRSSAEVREAMRFVDGLLEEVMGLGLTTQLQCVPIDPKELIERTLRGGVAFPPNVRVVIDAAHTQSILADAAKLQRVLLNILDNARSALGAVGGRVWLLSADAVVEARTVVRIVLGNDGPPIAEQDLEQIFEPYFTKGKVRGTGLGLAVCREIVAAHGGRLGCLSSKATGTEFWIELPAATSLTQAAASDALAPADPLIAVIDDCPFVRESWQLAVHDAEVATFASPSAFLEKLAQDAKWSSRLQVVVTDFDFGAGIAMDGAALARTLASDRLATAIPIFLSTDWAGRDADEGVLFTARVEKRPASLSELLNLARTIRKI